MSLYWIVRNKIDLSCKQCLICLLFFSFHKFARNYSAIIDDLILVFCHFKVDGLPIKANFKTFARRACWAAAGGTATKELLYVFAWIRNLKIFLRSHHSIILTFSRNNLTCNGNNFLSFKNIASFHYNFSSTTQHFYDKFAWWRALMCFLARILLNWKGFYHRCSGFLLQNWRLKWLNRQLRLLYGTLHLNHSFKLPQPLTTLLLIFTVESVSLIVNSQ